MTQDQVFVPKTRSERGLPPFNPEKEDLAGASISDELSKELWEALGDSPIGAIIGSFGYLVRFNPLPPHLWFILITNSPVDWWMV